VSGSSGEKANWNGARPVIEKLNQQAARIKELEEENKKLRNAFSVNGLTRNE